MKKRSGAHVLVESLVNEGLTTIFGIPGVDTLSVYDAFLDHPSVRAINVRHEQSAVFMADGYYRASGNVGVALTSGGPGALNTITAMGTAHNDSSAILHILNDNPAHVRAKGRGYFHDVRDQYGIFRPVIDFGYQATMPHEIPDSIRTAMTALKSRRPKPALVEIGGDAFKIPSDINIGNKSSSHRRAATDDELNQLMHEKNKNEKQAKREFEKRVADAKKKAIEDNKKLAKETGNKLTQNIDSEGNLVGVGSSTVENNLKSNEEISSADIRKELFEGDNIRTRETDRVQKEIDDNANIDMTVSEKKED